MDRVVLSPLLLALALSACGAPQSPAEPVVFAISPSTDAAAPAITASSASSSDVVDRRPLRFGPAKTGTRLTDDAIVVESPIAFAVGKAALLPESDVTLDVVRDILVANPSVTIDVQVHTDNLGSSQYNLALSSARADQVAREIERRGIDSKRITAHGFGETQPAVPNDTPEHRAMNRRVVLLRTDGH